MANFLDKFFGDPNARTIKRLQVVVEEINSFEPEIEHLTDTQLKERTLKLKHQIKEELGDPKDDHDILTKHQAEAFALVREAAKRTLGQRHFDVQLMSGLVMHEGNVSEQKTGEGKTLSATLAIFLNALAGRGAHVITVNDYLARRDAGWMGQVYDFLGLSVGCIVHDQSFLFSRTKFEDESAGEAPANEDPSDDNNPTHNLVNCSRQEAYRADITYGTNNEFGFDYLRDNMAPAPKYLRQRPLYYAVVDEVDSILIDEARTPLIISAPAEESGDRYDQFAQLAKRLTAEDYVVDEKEKAVRISDSGVQKIQQWLNTDNLYEEDNVLLVHHLDEALKAEYLFTRDKDYVVKDGEVLIVDEFTGRLMPGRRYSEGLHQAIEAKENVHVQRESDTLATVSFQNFFRLYNKLAGMTGTAKTEEEELIRLYNMEVVVVPTNRDIIRKDHSDKIYVSETAKFNAIIEDVRERQDNGQPVLLGTISVAKNEQLSKLMTKAGIPHEMLNAKNHEREAGIVANAGAPGAITLATNMAGRGTDIVLGGSPPEKEDQKAYAEWEKRRQIVLQSGGLAVVGSERHESRRIDNQLRGRAGRQGEPGESIFYVSMDDDLMRVFGGDKLKGLMEKTRMPEDIPIQNSIVSRSLEQAQKRVEGHNFDIRKHVVQYDDVMNKHREALYAKRKTVMEALGPEGNDPKAPKVNELKGLVRQMIHNQVENTGRRYLVKDKLNWDVEQLIKELSEIAPLKAEDQEKLKSTLEKTDSHQDALQIIRDGFMARYEQKEKEHTEYEQRLLERAVALRAIDSLWVEHLNVMQELRQGVGLQAIAQHDPLVVYQQRGFEQFQQLMSTIERETVRQLMHLTRVSREEAERRAQEAGQAPKQLILQGASEEDAGGSAGIRNASLSAEQQAQVQQSDVNITIRKVSDKLAAEGAAGSGADSNRTAGQKVGRNDPCPCGSGKKYKKCHGR